MRIRASYADGQFCRVDLMSRNLSEAKQFYTSLFGWQAIDQDTQGGPPYTIFTLAERQLCGLGQMSDEMQASGMPPVWNSYVSVDDLEKTLARAEQLGATVTMPAMQVVDAGKMAVIQDPTGAFVSFWEKINHWGAAHVNDPNTWVWNELLCNNPNSAISFYSQLFEWRFEKEQSDSPNDYWLFENDQLRNGGLMQITEDMQGCPPNWSVYFAVSEIDRATDGVQRFGGQVLNGPFEVSVGQIAVVTDPQGAAFQLIQLSVPPDD